MVLHANTCYQECKRDARDGGCEGSDRYVQENTIHSIALIVELTVGMREYGIEFCGVWGFAKLFQSFVDQAVFPRLPSMKHLPRAYLKYHMGRISDIHQQKRRPLTLDLLQSLDSVVGMEKCELYSSMRDWFAERKLLFQLPELEIKRETKLGERLMDCSLVSLRVTSNRLSRRYLLFLDRACPNSLLRPLPLLRPLRSPLPSPI